MANIPRVNRGERFRPRATDWNRIADVINRISASGRGVVGGPSDADSLPPGVILIRNNTEEYVPRFGVLGVDGSIVQPKYAKGEFESRIAVEGVAPNAADRARGRFVVTIEPIRPGAIGRAMIRGEIVCRVEMSDESHLFATFADDVYDRLVSASSGPAQLLYVEALEERERPEDPDDPFFVPDDEDQKAAWCVISIGIGGAAGTNRAVIVCSGPNGESAPTDNRYYVSPMILLEVAEDEPAEPSADDQGEIVLATNLGESGTHTHALHVGTVVEIWAQTDEGDVAHTLFNRVP